MVIPGNDRASGARWAFVGFTSAMGVGRKLERFISGTRFSVEAYYKSSHTWSPSVSPYYSSGLFLGFVSIIFGRNSFFTGVVSTVCVIGIPLKFQAVHGDSALQAGIRLLPFTILTPCGSMLAASLTGKAKMPPIYLQFVGAALQVIGVALMSRDANANASVSAASYVFEVIIGLGIGISIVSVTIVAPFVIKDPVDLCEFSMPRSCVILIWYSNHHICRHSVSVYWWSTWSGCRDMRNAEFGKTKTVSNPDCGTTRAVVPVHIRR